MKKYVFFVKILHYYMKRQRLKAKKKKINASIGQWLQIANRLQ